MMVSIALTLIVILAVIRLFDMVGGTVSESRSILELSAQLRNVSQQLQRDLDRATVTMIPPVDPDGGGGFFELIEGPDTDWDPQFGILFDREANAGRNVRNPALPDPTDINGQLQDLTLPNGALPNHFYDQSGRYGDLDDVLMFTIRSDGEPFVGHVDPGRFGISTSTIQSEYAVVVWWVEPYFVNAQMKSLRLHRRQFLVAPNVELVNAAGIVTTLGDELQRQTTTDSRDWKQPQFLTEFLAYNDLAVYSPVNGQGLRAATLSDLADRKKRIAHNATSGLFFHPNDIGVVESKRRGQLDLHTIYPAGVLASQNPQLNYSAMSNAEKWQLDKQGTDVVIADILVFDVKVYSPDAPLLQTPPPGNDVVLAPHDRGFVEMVRNDSSLVLPGNVFMRGAFVDLYYGRHLASPLFGSPNSQYRFGTIPQPKSPVVPGVNRTPIDNDYRTNLSAVYDTWSTGYERDGLNQDISEDSLIDEGVDGLDNDGNGVVDDILEKETIAPYPHPLRGIEVTIRVVEPGGSQQIRQTSVVANFKHE